jgi:DNA excision repair protein ERCC-2
VQNALQRDQLLLLNAPTGLGKSVSVLFPALQNALSTGRRVFFATAKNTGREAAFQVLRGLEAAGSKVSCVAMSAREGMCPADIYFCQESTCRFLRGMEKRLPQALESLSRHLIVDREHLVKTGVKHEICPHELALILSETRDLVVGDYNYAMDPRIRIRRLFVEGDANQLVLIVDEAHNLAPRARDWFSAELKLEDLQAVCRELENRQVTGGLFHGGHLLETALSGMHKAVRGLITYMENWQEMLDESFQFARDSQEVALGALFKQDELGQLQSTFEGHLLRYVLGTVMQGVAESKDPIVDFHYAFERFTSLAARRDEAMHQVVRLNPTNGENLAFEVRCSWAGDWLSENLHQAPSAILLSATLKPWDWNSRELGIQHSARIQLLDAPSPFPPENRCLIIHEGLSVRYRDRGATLSELATLVQEAFEVVQGNMAVFLPSFAYLRDLRSALPKGLPLLVHDGTMEPLLREALLKRLANSGPHLLLTVMGGIFAEAVDFPGRMLESAFVVGLGLPGLSHERELARQFYDQRGEAGFDNAYRLPGLCRVLQAAGRVIRRPEDRGSIVFVDDRFTRWENLQLIEESYAKSPERLSTSEDVIEALRMFHEEEPPDLPAAQKIIL